MANSILHEPVFPTAPALGNTPPTSVLYLDHTAKMSGGEIALLRLLQSLDPVQVRPVVVLAEDGPLVGRLQEISVETHVLPLSQRIRDVRKDTLGAGTLRRAGVLFPLLRYAAQIARFARQHKIQIIHTNSLKSDLYGALAGRLAHIPVVWHVRDHINPSYLPAPAVHIFRFLARRLPFYIIANSQSTRDELCLAVARPSVVVSSGIDFHTAVIHDGLTVEETVEMDAGEQERLQSKRLQSNRLRIGIVGRLAAWKGQHIFLEAAETLTEKGYQAEYVIIGSAMFGEAEYEANIRRMADSDALRDSVTFLGFQKDVASLLRGLDILVHASTTPEPFGQVVIEGMAEGLPVVGTDGGGVREIITHGENGLLVPMGDAAALARALERLITNPDEARRMGRAAYAHVRQNFTSAQTARRVERVYQYILALS